MKIIKNTIMGFLTMFVVSLFVVSHVLALGSYTITQVAEHATPDNCWMVINQNVYDLSQYLPDHDNKLDIRPWCGKDATSDYNSKNGKGQGHSGRADSLLNSYIIGTLGSGAGSSPTTIQNNAPVVSPTLTTNTVTGKNSDDDSEEEDRISPSIIPTSATNVVQNKKFTGYNIFFPLFGTIIGYFLSFRFLKRQIHNFIWNSVMLLGLIPSFIFGMIMAFAKQYAWADALKYKDMLVNHVELSVIFGVACVLHFVLRLKIYLAQGKSGIMK